MKGGELLCPSLAHMGTALRTSCDRARVGSYGACRGFVSNI